MGQAQTPVFASAHRKRGYWKVVFFCILFACACWNASVMALTLQELDPEQEWRVKEIIFSGNILFSAGELSAEILTRQRPWYKVWQKRPMFDPVAFATDLERVQRFYDARGYYQSEVTYDLQVEHPDKLVTVQIQVKEGSPVTVADVTVEIPPPTSALGDGSPPAFPGQLPLQSGQIFTEEAYQQGEKVLRDFFLDQGHARVHTQRRAEVDLERGQARVQYTAQPGPQAVFGPTTVEGTEKVDPSLILRELTYQPGNQFSLQQIEQSREKIVNLGLFRSVQLTPEQAGRDQKIVPMRIRVEEQLPRDIKLGIGYGTEDEFRGQAEWRHRNWLGGGRQLSFSLKLSAITRSLEAAFIQPHFPTPRSRVALNLTQRQEDEETYLLNASRFQPRLEHQISPTLSGFVGYELEFLKFNNVDASTIQALGGIRRDGVVSGLSLGLVWNTTEDPFDPRQGSVVSLLADQAGEVWGGDYRFYKITAEAKKYQRLGWETVLAGRFKIGIADTFGSRTNIPLSERFYSGGEKTVRGYGRRRLGPLSDSDDPLGGLSLVEGSLELRRPLWQVLSGVVFLDFGQVSRRSVNVPVDDLEFAAGLGVGYTTPLGPLQLYLGFPFDPPRNDQAWQVHFSIGQFF